MSKQAWRIYFNHRAAAPWVWSIDRGTQETEQHVWAVVLSGIPATSRFNGDIPNDNSPCAWFEIEADSMEIVHGVATFR